MKREILCNECLKEWERAVHPPHDTMITAMEAAEMADEWCKRKTGLATRHCVCDGCGKHCSPGDHVNAVSMGNSRIHYFEWEHEFIEAQP